MRSRCLTWAAILCALPSLAPAAEAPSAGQPDISGVYVPVVDDRTYIWTIDGKPPPFKREAAIEFYARIESQGTEKPWGDTRWVCLPPGMPRLALWVSPYPFEILQTPGRVTIAYESAEGMARRIYLNRGHPEHVEPTWSGDSVGHWDGDTLVIDTIGINGKGTIDRGGTPQSDQVHVVERIRRIAPDQLENIVTIEDPETFTESWTARIVYALDEPGTEIMENVCEENYTLRDDDGYLLRTRY